MIRPHEPTVEVSITLSELRAVTKSLSIGCDQLAKKLQRMGDSSRVDDLVQEYSLLMEAKKEFESVLVEALQ